jgi:hypothetical protein
MPRAGRRGGSSAWQHGRPIRAAVGGEHKPWPTSRSRAIPFAPSRALQGRQPGSQTSVSPAADLSDISLADFEGKVEIRNLVPTLDTSVGAAWRAASSGIISHTKL